MIYIINGNVIYDCEQSEIRYHDIPDEQRVSLTPTTNRLLAFLITHQGQTIKKNDLLVAVWENAGYEGSSNTLMQYLSNLRKIFKDIIPDIDIITTVPRKGYRFTDEVTIEIREPPALTVAINQESPLRRFRFPLMLLTAVVITSATIIIYLSNMQSKALPAQNTTFLMLYKECPVYTLHVLLSVEREELYKERFMKLAEEHQIRCSPASSFFMSINRGAEHGVSGNVMLSKCTENENLPNACISYQYNRW